jgi:transmembrane sensor
MPNLMKGEARSLIDEEAITWFVLLRDEAATTEDRARFAAWLDADPRHRQAWQEIEGLWTGIDNLRPGGSEVLPFRPHPGRSRAAASAPIGRRDWKRLVAVAAMLLVIMGAAGFWAAQPSGFAAALFADYRTATGELRTVTLPDGSTVALGASSSLSVAFDDATRRVVLHQGEGYFSVMSDAARPFLVEAADGRITVVGTAFDVKLGGGGGAVAVAAGVVEVTAGTGPGVRLTPGQGVRYGANGMGVVHAIDTTDVGSWRSERLIFQAAPLGEVLHDLERYQRGRILVTDDRVAALPVTGVFDTRRPAAALDTIARTLPVKLVHITDLLVLIRPAD